MARRKTDTGEKLITDAWWLEPLKVGTRKELRGDVDGFEWVAAMEADTLKGRRRITDEGKEIPDVGWSKIVGLAVGLYGSHDFDELTVNRLIGSGSIGDSTPMPDIVEVSKRAITAATRSLADFEDTRRIRVDLDTDVRRAQPRDPVVRHDPHDRSRADERRIAARIYNLVTVELGKSNPGTFIDAYLGIGSTKRVELLAEAERLGLLETRLQPKKPKKKPTKTTAKKTTTRKTTTKGATK